MALVPREIFKTYDIRGIVGKTLTPEIVASIVRAIGTEARHAGLAEIVVGRDSRLSGPELARALVSGLRATGMHVVDLGQVTTPMCYFAAQHLATQAGVMLTGSHNPPDYNGLKVVLAGATLSGDAIQGLRRRIETDDFVPGSGRYRQHDIAAAYTQRIIDDIKPARPMRIVIDAGNGIAGAYAPGLYRALGCTVDAMYCDVDGHFPNHHPDPSRPENLGDLSARVQATGAEIGLAFDGDGDRLGVVGPDGRILWPDRQLMLFAADVLSRSPGGTIIFDVKSTRNLFPWIRAHGGVPLLWKTGHSLLKAKLKETGALLAGEMSGHIFFQERWYGFDDGLYAGARLIEILSRQADVGAALNALPDSLNTPELQIALAEGEAHRLMAELTERAVFDGATEVIRLDGLRVEYADGFGLMRASNTTPALTLRFEADTAEALARIQTAFRAILARIRPDLTLPF
ncbi:MAG: phosphomannomutase/phosphoglucomutase [Hydrogenophilales bacterium]|nr:phosphomannomutase/phosphoglucomutase [Hydrogenophilales bacterium]